MNGSHNIKSYKGPVKPHKFKKEKTRQMAHVFAKLMDP